MGIAVVVARMPSYRLQWYWVLMLLLVSCTIVFASAVSPSNSLRRRVDEEAETAFVDECTWFLLSDETLDDDLISQDEFANFLTEYCISMNVCDADTNFDFENFYLELQLAFVLFICDQPRDSERERCLDDLLSDGAEFGYEISEYEWDAVEWEVEQLCSEALPYASYFMGSPMPPSTAPTTAPSEATERPSLVPTPYVSSSPIAPTTAPSVATVPPTLVPTPYVSSSPIAPTTAPSVATVPPTTLVPTPNGGSSSPIAPTTPPSEATVPPTLFPTPNDGSSSGSPSPTEGDEGPLVSTNSGLSTPAVAGMSVAAVAAAVVAVVALLLFLRRRGRAVHKEKEVAEYAIAGDESIYTEDSAQFKLGLPQSLQGSIRGSISGSSLKSSSGSDHTPKNSVLDLGKSRSVAQFDPSNAAAAIALGLGGGVIMATGSSRGSSVRSMDRHTREAKIHDLDEAISCGDWEKVARLAGSLASSSEDVSTMSEISSNAGPATSVRSSRSSLRTDEASMAARIEELVQLGDWSGVAAAAAENVSSTNDRNRANQGVADASGEQPRRSFLDFVTGRRTLSSAADAAIVPVSQDQIVSDASERSVVGAATPAVFELGSGQSNTLDTESSCSHGSPKDKRDNRVSNAVGAAAPVVAEKSSNSFLGRFWYGRTSSKGLFDSSSQDADDDEGDKKPAASSSTTGLRAELDEGIDCGDWGKKHMAELRAELDKAIDCGDWGTIEAISAKIDASSARTSRQKGGMSRSAIIKQFVSKGSSADDDPIIGAASLPSSKNSPKRSGEGSTPSRRAELDNAVKIGDWESVERLTTELVNSNPASQRDGSFQVLTDDDKLTDTLLMDNAALSPIVASPSSKPPARVSPSSSEWSQSPIEKEKMDSIRKLIDAGDWQSVHVLSGIFEMEKNGTLPPTFASMSADSAEASAGAQGWLRPEPTGTTRQISSGLAPLPDAQHNIGPARPPPSPATSSSTDLSGDLKEFQRFVNEKDWKGLATFAGAEQEGDSDNDEPLARDLFDADSDNEGVEVELRQAGGPTPKIIETTERDRNWIRGAKLSIPFRKQVVVDQPSPDAANADASNADASNADASK